jgi:hypothetical protein
MVARSATAIPAGERWRYEPKLDGFRCIALVRPGGEVRLQSRQHRPLTQTGSLDAPSGLVLGRPDPRVRLRVIGRTRPLHAPMSLLAEQNRVRKQLCF